MLGQHSTSKQHPRPCLTLCLDSQGSPLQDGTQVFAAGSPTAQSTETETDVCWENRLAGPVHRRAPNYWEEVAGQIAETCEHFFLLPPGSSFSCVGCGAGRTLSKERILCQCSADRHPQQRASCSSSSDVGPHHTPATQRADCPFPDKAQISALGLLGWEEFLLI